MEGVVVVLVLEVVVLMVLVVLMEGVEVVVEVVVLMEVEEGIMSGVWLCGRPCSGDKAGSPPPAPPPPIITSEPLNSFLINFLSTRDLGHLHADRKWIRS